MAPGRATPGRLAWALISAVLAASGAAQATAAQTQKMIVAQASLVAPAPARRSAPQSTTGATKAAPAVREASMRAPRPTARGARFAAKVGQGQRRQQTATLQTTPGVTAGARPRASSGRSVQAAATIPSAMSRDAPSLIGVFGGSDTRRALIRTPEGALRMVRQGERLARWTVSAIGPDSVQLRDGARAQTLRIPGS